MAFSLTRPPSPSRESGHISTQDYGDDHLSSPFHATLSSLAPGSSAQHPDHHDMIKEKERVGIDIVVDSDCLSLRGTGVDVEPALLKGHILLHLKESTSIREITLQFRGKARLPAPSADTLALSTSSQWYTICNHEWSFLEGEKRHSHTLKAGMHQFPFQLQLGGSLPSSISNGYGGAHVSYKLRAVAVRPGLAHNMQAAMPITIVRTFAPEALEYQQSLEIENTWPEKLMYSIMIPHKAWAAGDKLTAIVKFSPLAKGVRVLSVTTTIHETTKSHSRGGVQEHGRTVVTANHDIYHGDLMSVSERHGGIRAPPFLPPPGLSQDDRSESFGSHAPTSQDLSLRQVPSRASSSSSPLSHDSHSTWHSDATVYSADSEASSTAIAEEDVPMSQDDTVAQLTVFIPKSVTPSHLIEPIVVSHRIRWSILMSNLDGHTSELRCSLPLHILDARLLDEARTNSAATRRLLLGSSEAPVDEEQDTELPSYSAHVRDRVANMYLPDSATTRVLNPWVHASASPTFMPERLTLPGAYTPGNASPLMPHPVSSHLPPMPQSGVNTPLEWVNSELLLSLSTVVPPVPRINNSPPSPSPPDSISRPESRLVSRRNSRAPSPDHLLMMPLSAHPVTSAAGFPFPETFVHDGHASRTLPGVFSIQMKPHTSLTSPGWLSSRSNSLSSLTSLGDVGHGHGHGHGLGHAHRPSLQSLYSTPRQSACTTVTLPVPTATSVVTESVPEDAMWHRALTEVPDYDVASRGFIGGVTPLTSMRGLPSYEEAERSLSGGGEEDAVTIRRATRGERVA